MIWNLMQREALEGLRYSSNTVYETMGPRRQSERVTEVIWRWCNGGLENEFNVPATVTRA